MKIKELLAKDRVSLSFEVFPPKKIDSFATVQRASFAIAQLKPSFMSVTFGAAGTTAGFTMELAESLQKEQNVTVLPHLTCVSSNKDLAIASVDLGEAYPYCVAVAKGDPKGLLPGINEAIADMLAKGKVDEFVKAAQIRRLFHSGH